MSILLRGASVLLVHPKGPGHDNHATIDTRIPPKGEKTFRLLLPDRPWIERVRVTLRSQFDFEPIATAEAPLE